jgi:hypothetical protein
VQGPKFNSQHEEREREREREMMMEGWREREGERESRESEGRDFYIRNSICIVIHPLQNKSLGSVDYYNNWEVLLNLVKIK